MHVASNGGPPPRSLIRAVFRYAFENLKCKVLFGIVEESNEAALRLDRWLGFREVYRVAGCANDGGDLILLEMRREKCRWLGEWNG